MRTAKQARRTADKAADLVPLAMARYRDLLQSLDAIVPTLHPAVQRTVLEQAEAVSQTLLDMESVVGVVTPAALFGE